MCLFSKLKSKLTRTLIEINKLEDFDLRRQALCQISRCKFNVEASKCIVQIKSKEDKIIYVYISRTVRSQDFKEQAIRFNVPIEPSLYFLSRQLSFELEKNNKICLFSFLKGYKQKYYKSGKELEGQYFFKMYSRNLGNLNEGLRSLYGANWINYHEQLSGRDSGIIYDEGVCGLWAMRSRDANRCISIKDCKDHYGNRIFVLKPIKECFYFIYKVDFIEITIEEVIGDKYEVIKDFSLENDKDIDEIKRYIDGDETIS